MSLTLISPSVKCVPCRPPGFGGPSESADAPGPRRWHHPLLAVRCGAAPRWALVDPQDQGTGHRARRHDATARHVVPGVGGSEKSDGGKFYGSWWDLNFDFFQVLIWEIEVGYHCDKDYGEWCV